jgi:hypothetical protein
MSTLIDTPRSAGFRDGLIFVVLQSGAELRFPASENPRLAHATPAQLNNIELSPFGLHWPDLDEDLSVQGILEGDYGQHQETPSHRSDNAAAPSSDEPEAAALKLLADLHTELSATLNSLSGKQPQAVGDRYHLYAAAYINRAAEGYWLLRTEGRVDASKLLLRPAIEAMVRIQALRKNPELLFNIAWTERLEDRKWLRPVALKHGVPYDDNADNPGWKRFEDAYKKEFPNASPVGSKLSAYSAAEAAGLADYYNSHYRMYCQYTHAALQATGGYLNELTDPEDTRTMVLCAYCALSAVANIGGVSTNLKSLHDRVDNLSKTETFKLVRQVAS